MLKSRLLLLLAASFALTGARPASTSVSPVVLELFTSQGCSSCPPADRLAARLARDPSLVVISRPVTYWDDLGWHDTFAREENTVLQRAYAVRGLVGQNGVFTPQIVADGQGGAIGSDAQAVNALVRYSRRAAKPRLAVQAGKDGRLVVTISGQAAGDPATLSIVALDRSAKVAIGRGENSGHSVTYTDIYLGERALGEWAGGTKRYAIPAALLHAPGADRYALLLRIGQVGPILAARFVS